MPDKHSTIFEFENFRLDARQPSLWLGGELVSVAPKALEILVLLIKKNGEIVSREELLEKVWEDTFVEEANITYTVSLLRKALGEKKLIQTVPKRGYRFTAEIRKPEEVQEEEANAIPSKKGESIKSFPIAAAKKKRSLILAFVSVLSLIFFTGFGFYFWQSGDSQNISATKRNIKTLAVLPFRNLTDGEDNALALGLTDSLISRLGSLRHFTIRPLSAVENFAKSQKDALEFGEELNCDAVLVGTFQTAENRLRVNVKLLDVRDGTQIWTTEFTGNEDDIFLVQSNLARQVASSLLEKLTESDEKLLGKKHTEDPEAYRAYLRGRTIFLSRKKEAFQETLDEYQKAISLDPTFALAYAGVADLFSRLGNSLNGADSDDAYKKAESFAKKALELDGDLTDAHASLGLIKRLHDWDWETAEKEYKRAIELDPNNTNALVWYAQLLSILGKHDAALAAVNRAIEIDPITPSTTSVLFPILESRGDLDEGLQKAEQAYLFDKESIVARRAYATFLYHRGKYAEVIELVEETLPRTKQSTYAWLSLLAASYQKMGQTEKAEEHLRKLEEAATENSKHLYSLAVNYAELGRNDEAINALEKCYELREERLAWINVEPRLNNLKYDARFQGLLKRMNLV